MKKVSLGILFVGVSLFGATSGFADGIAGSCPCDMGFDENGNGFINAVPEPGILAPDPGPGGLAAVLTYALPFAGVAGDVGLTSDEGTSDYLRFNGNATLVFYSDKTDGTDAIGDTASPASFYANLIFIPEVGLEGGNGVIYVPTAGQPGFNLGGDQYVILSDGVLTVIPIPEPATLTLFGSGIVAMAGYGLRRLKKSARDRKGEGGCKKNARVSRPGPREVRGRRDKFRPATTSWKKSARHGGQRARYIVPLHRKVGEKKNGSEDPPRRRIGRVCLVNGLKADGSRLQCVSFAVCDHQRNANLVRVDRQLGNSDGSPGRLGQY